MKPFNCKVGCRGAEELVGYIWNLLDYKSQLTMTKDDLVGRDPSTFFGKHLTILILYMTMERKRSYGDHTGNNCTYNVIVSIYRLGDKYDLKIINVGQYAIYFTIILICLLFFDGVICPGQSEIDQCNVSFL